MIRLFLSLLAVLTLSSCASITQGTSQTVTFNLEPETAKCVATRDGDGQIGTITPANNNLTVSKSKRDIMVKCSAPGYKSTTVRLVSSTRAAGVVGGVALPRAPQGDRVVSSTRAAGVVGGVLLDLGIVDMMTGAMWAYEGSVNVALDKLEP